ncbi:MAG: hypothetical protein IBX61_09810, partial [Thermoleophilia bacterium]|nr:hypothetical protein [Thermoleophilia bacterium]
ADFDIKTYQESGDTLHGFEHEVEAMITLDGKPFAAKKSYHEVYKKKRGSATEAFDGHTTDHSLDGVPVKEKQYKDAIAEICDERTFRLLTDLRYFNEVMSWQERRELLLAVCGDASDADVIASDSELSELPDILEGRSPDDHKAVVMAARKKINEELKEIPARIDETSRSLPETDASRESVETALTKLREAAQVKHQERARLTDGGQAAKKRRQLSEAKAELQMIESKARASGDEVVRVAQKAIDDLIYRIDTLTRDIQQRESTIGNHQASIQRLNGDMGKLREKWQATNAENFADGTETTCAACGQDLPTERVQEARDKALAAFNRDKAERLERIDAEGKEAKRRISELALGNEGLRKEIQELEAERDPLAEKRDNSPVVTAVNITFPPEFTAKEAAVKALEAEIAQLDAGNADALAEVDAQIADLKGQIQEQEAALGRIEQHERGQQRIQELGAQEKALAAQYERLESELYLIDQFTRAKVSMLTEKINGRFKTARFRLFNVQINGGIEPCCVALMDNKPYPALSTGERIRISMDILCTLSEHYDMAWPVFLDHAESLTGDIEAPGQLIRLIAAPGVKELKVEKKSTLREAANV